ncbi:MAG: transcription termination factor NusA [Alphaproteobacteria bacterium]|nr:transcription termination factor NusA [Alphaproteobacteria bacterium]
MTPETATQETESLSIFPRLELLQVADTVAREKGIDREEVLEAMEQAIQKAGRSKYGHELDIRATIDRKTGEIHLYRYREVAEELENEAAQLSLEAARQIKPDAELGEFLVDPLPPIDFGRIAAQTAKQVIVQKVREAERKRQYDEYKDRISEIVNGLVKRVEFGNVMVDLGRAEAILRREELIPRENFRPGDRVRAYIYDVREELRGPQIFLSRTRPEFMAQLFAQEVPEIYDGIIEIRAVARDPGSRAKIAVVSKDSSIDPVGACVGMRGSRVQAVVAELQGEKIDIIPWSQDPATFVVNALAPAEVVKVVLDEDSGSLEVIVPDDQLSLAIGRRGQNVRLASQLTGWDIDILTETEESDRRTEEFRRSSQLFMEALEVDDVIAHLLVTEGFSSVEEVGFVPLDDLADIEGFSEEIAGELRERARAYLAERDAELRDRCRELGVEDAVGEIEGVTPSMMVTLGEAGIKTLDDLGDLSNDELRAIVGAANQPAPTPPPAEPEAESTVAAEAEAEQGEAEAAGEQPIAAPEPRSTPASRRGEPEPVAVSSVDDVVTLPMEVLRRLWSLSRLTEAEANDIIMAARAHWFEDEEAPANDQVEADASEADEGTAEQEPSGPSA